MGYSKLKPKTYIPRLVDQLVEENLSTFGGIELQGMRWSGKSWTALAHGSSITRVDDNEALYQEEPELALQGAKPHIIDEWQDVPSIWNYARHEIDDSANEPGQFIFTGSSTPPDEEKRHSGAGRIARIRMSTMTLSETGESSAAVSLNGLFNGQFSMEESHMDLQSLSAVICRGGWPALQTRKQDASRIIGEYLEAFFDVSIPHAGKSPSLARRIAQSLARNVATSATLKTIADDAAMGESSALSEKTIGSYIEVFLRNYVLTELKGWDAPVRSKSRLRTKPKRYFDDPSIAAALLGVDQQRLLEDAQLMGLLFESLCIHDLSVYVKLLPGAYGGPLAYYGDSDGLEVDAIIELRDGRWGAFEIKLGESKVDNAAKTLIRLQEKIQANPTARNPQATFLAVLVGKGTAAYRRRSDGVYVIPIDTLGA